MSMFLVGLFGLLLGAGVTFVLLERKRAEAKEARVAATELERHQSSRLETIRAADALRQEREAEFQSRSISYDELVAENGSLKETLGAIAATVRHEHRQSAAQQTASAEIDQRAQDLAVEFMKETERWIGKSLTSKNYTASKARLVKAIEKCRRIGFDVTAEREEELLSQLASDYEIAVRAELEREEQSRIRAQIRDEQRREKEIQRELAALEREREAIKAALEQALATATDEHSAEIERLKERLAESEERNQRAISQAQLTRAGHIYVISNVGSFGENVYKIGMTRRLEPLDRVKELGDASVPFPFDIHMMIASDDAPTLENELHHNFHRHRVNRINLRKEFFKVDLDDIRRFVERRHGEVRFTADAEALEYREGLEMTGEEQDYVSDVFTRAKQATGIGEDDDE